MTVGAFVNGRRSPIVYPR